MSAIVNVIQILKSEFVVKVGEDICFL